MTPDLRLPLEIRRDASTIHLPVAPGAASAVISQDGRYRFRLSRQWGVGPRPVFCMLNPSTADGTRDDPTIRRCMGFARAWGYGGIEVVNLFPWRATDPRDLVEAHRRGEDIALREERDRHVRLAVNHDTHEVVVIAAWGAHPLAREECRTLPDVALRCLGTTKSGAPRHPLYLPTTATLRPWLEDAS